MDQSTTTAAATTEPVKASVLKKKYGVHKAPLKVSHAAIAFRRDMNFDEQFKTGPNKQTTHSWIVMDPALNNGAGLLVRANTYNGGLGDRVDYLNPANTKPIPESKLDDDGKETNKDRRQTLKGYSPIALTEVPFIEVLPAPKDDEKEENEGGESKIELGDQSADGSVKDLLSADEELNDDGAPV